MIKTLTTLVIIVALLVCGVMYYLPSSRALVSQRVNETDKKIYKHVSDEELFSQILAELDEDEKYVFKQFTKIVDSQAEMAKIESAVVRLEKDIKLQEMAINKAFNWLESHNPGDEVIVGGKKVEYDTVLADALDKKDTCQTLRVELSGAVTSRNNLRSAIETGKSQVDKALKSIDERRGKLAAQKVELAAWNMIQRTHQFIEDMNLTGINLDSSPNFQELQRRLNEKVYNDEYDKLRGRKKSEGLNWNSEETRQSDLEILRSYRNQHIAKPSNTPSAQIETLDLPNETVETPAY